MVAYCLQCETQRCEAIAHLLELRGAERAFSPRIITRHRKAGRLEDRYYAMLPGYIFVYTGKALEDFRLFAGISGFIRVLGQGPLTLADEDFAMDLYRRDGSLGAVSLFRRGDAVIVDDPLFQRYSAEVADVDWRKQRARITFLFDGHEKSVWVACDMIRPGQK